jgi:MFS family permease
LQPSTRLTVRLGVSQFIGWSSGFYLPAILAVPISTSLGIGTEIFFWAFTVALLVSAFLGPVVGKWIDVLGGRKVLPYGNLFFIAGLLVLAFSTNVQLLFLAWLLIGVGAAMGNYDAAFATAVNFFGNDANKVIAGITVFVGFSSTISWPLNAWVSETYGWQSAVLVWAVAHLVIGLPLNLTIPKSEPRIKKVEEKPKVKNAPVRIRFDGLIVVFAVMFAFEGFMVASVNTTLPYLLGELGASAQLALFAAAILGPSQVLARILIVVLGKVMSPMRVAAVSFMAHPVGVVLILFLGVDALVPFVILHGISVGLDPFIRGTLPLLFFGPEDFGRRQGYIMMLSKIVGAASPLLLTILVVRDPTLAIITTMSMGIGATALLVWLSFIRKAQLQKIPPISD